MLNKGRWMPTLMKKKKDVHITTTKFLFHDYVAFHATWSKYFKTMCQNLGSIVHLMSPHPLRHYIEPSLTR